MDKEKTTLSVELGNLSVVMLILVTVQISMLLRYMAQ